MRAEESAEVAFDRWMAREELTTRAMRALFKFCEPKLRAQVLSVPECYPLIKMTIHFTWSNPEEQL